MFATSVVNRVSRLYVCYMCLDYENAFKNWPKLFRLKAGVAHFPFVNKEGLSREGWPWATSQYQVGPGRFNPLGGRGVGESSVSNN